MKILTLEFSSPQRSVAVVQAQTPRPPLTPSSRQASPIPASQDPPPEAETHARSRSFHGQGEGIESPETVEPAIVLGEAVQPSGSHTLAFAMIQEALLQGRVEREQIDCIAVGLGPGSYTGIRLAISIAQGWQLARKVRSLGVSSMDALARQGREANLRGRVHLVIDAHRDQFYLASYEITDADIHETKPLCLADGAEVKARAQTGGVLAGPEIKRWFPDGRTLFPHAAALGRLAATRTDFVPGDKLEPIYLRTTAFVKAPPPRTIATP